MRRAAKILLGIIAALVFLLAVIYETMLTKQVQTFLAQRATSYLSSKLHTRVKVDKVYIRFIRSVVMNGLLVEDMHGDTLLYANELSADISQFSLKKNILDIKSIRLDHANFNIIKHKGEKHDNLKFISEFFASPGKKDTTSAKLKLTIENVNLNEVHFTKKDYNYKFDTIGVDFSNLDVTHLNGDIDNIHFIKDSAFADIKGLRLTDHGGFVLNDLSAKTRFSPGEWRFNRLDIITPQTEIHTDLAFHLDSIDDFDDFDTKVSWVSNFKLSTVSLADIAFFAHDLWGRTNKLKLSGDVRGMWSKFRATNVFLGVGPNTWLKGDIAMTGLSNIDETYIEIQAKDAQGIKSELETIPIPPFNTTAHIKLPDNIAVLGKMNFKGRFTGFINDFVAYGNISTAIGYLSSDINLKFDDSKNKMAYKGHLSASNFNAGKFLSVNDLGPVSFSVDIKGNGIRKETADADLTGIISSIEFRKYAYRNVKINSEIAKRLFKGSLSVHDDNVDFDFNGNIDFRNDLPEFDFVADVGKAHLDTLNLFKLQGEATLQTTLNIKIKGNKLDNLEGTVEAVNTSYHSDSVAYHVGSISLKSLLDNNSRYIYFTSDFLDATISGRVEFATLFDGFKNILPRYLPSVVLPVKSKIISNQNFSFDIHFKNTDLITENFLPQWYVEPNTYLKGDYNSLKNKLNVRIQSPLIRYSSFNFHDADLKINADSLIARIIFNADYITTGKQTRIELPSLNAEARNNNIAFHLKLADSVSFASHADLGGIIVFVRDDKFSIHIGESSVYVENNRWVLDSVNSIHFDSSSINVSHVGFTNGSQQLQVNGIVAKNDSAVVQMSFNNFQLENLDPFIGDVKLGGSTNGTASATDVYSHIKFSSDLSVDQLQVNNDTLGNAKLISTFDNENKVLSVNASIQNGTKDIFTANGQYYTAKKDDNLDFKIHVEDLYLQPIARYVKSIMDIMSAKLSGELQLHGTPDHPVFTGLLSLQRARILVYYLNTIYSFTNNVIVNEDNFELRDFVLNDEYGKSAVANGKIYHDNFKNLRFDVRLDADHFEALKTKESQNPIYYGTAIGTGFATFQGPPDNMKMYIAMKSEKGTQINLPLSGSSDVSQSDFITFTSKDSSQQVVKQPLLTGLDLNLNAELTEDAKMQIIFDEKIGDKMTGYGSGILNLTLSPLGEFAINGTYTIEKGDYLFTAQNVINKYFTINRGGTITWSGDPYGAIVNLSATYKTKASLYDLTLDSTLKSPIPIECKIKLTNKLMNPTVNFEVSAPGANPNAQDELSLYMNNQYELSRQVGSLMLQNRFMRATSLTPSGQNSTQIDPGASLSISGTQFLSSQLSNWISQTNLPIIKGVNVQPGNAYTKEDIEFMLSKSLLNDKVTIDGNVGVASGLSPTSGSNTNNLVGDFNAEYKYTDMIRFRAFNKTNTNTLIFNNSPYTQGIGVFFRKEFDTFNIKKKRSMKKMKMKMEKEKGEVKSESEK